MRQRVNSFLKWICISNRNNKRTMVVDKLSRVPARLGDTNRDRLRFLPIRFIELFVDAGVSRSVRHIPISTTMRYLNTTQMLARRCGRTSPHVDRSPVTRELSIGTCGPTIIGSTMVSSSVVLRVSRCPSAENVEDMQIIGKCRQRFAVGHNRSHLVRW